MDRGRRRCSPVGRSTPGHANMLWQRSVRDRLPATGDRVLDQLDNLAALREAGERIAASAGPRVTHYQCDDLPTTASLMYNERPRHRRPSSPPDGRVRLGAGAGANRRGGLSPPRDDSRRCGSTACADAGMPFAACRSVARRLQSVARRLANRWVMRWARAGASFTCTERAAAPCATLELPP